MLSSTVLRLMEIAINRYVALDPETQAKLHRLAGNYITIECTGLPKPFIFQLQLTANRICVLPDDPTVLPTTYIKGTPLGLCRLGRSSEPGLVNEDVEIQGDIELGQTINLILDNMEIDWEGLLAKGIGDVAAHTVGNVARHIKHGITKTVDTTRVNVSEYVTEEICLTPPVQALVDFYADVDQLRDDVARLALRVERLTKRLSS